MTALRIRRARVEESASLTRLARASKAIWGYPQALRAQFDSELAVTPDYIRENLVLVAEGAEGGPLAVGALIALEEDAMELGLMFVAPGQLRRGIGMTLFRDLCIEARARGCCRLKIVSDPNAVGFYRLMGAVQVGEEESGSIAGRMLPVLHLELGARP